MAKNISVFGIYPDRAVLADAIDVLRQSGYRAADISFLSADNQGSQDFAHEKSTKAPEGAAAGAAAGAALGAMLASLAAVGAMATPGLDPLIAAGPVTAALAGAGGGGALGWLIGFLAGLGMPEYEARRYSGRNTRGGVLLSVHCDSWEWCVRAKQTLKNTGALHISSALESAAGKAEAGRPAVRVPAGAADRG
jgi:hypothetical protein